MIVQLKSDFVNYLGITSEFSEIDISNLDIFIKTKLYNDLVKYKVIVGLDDTQSMEEKLKVFKFLTNN